MHSPSFQIISTFILQFILFLIFVIPSFFKHKIIMIIKVILQILFLLSLIGIMVVHFSNNFSNSNNRSTTGMFTIVMFTIFVLFLALFAIFWIIFRYCLKSKFRNLYFNKDFSDEGYLKYYKKIPEKMFAFGQRAKVGVNTQIKPNQTYVEEGDKSNQNYKFINIHNL